MNETSTDIISSFVDHEAVDPDALAAALEDPASRALLVDFVRLRQAVAATDGPLPASLATLRPRPIARVAVVRWTAAAALLVLFFLAGWMSPRPFTPADDVSESAPPPPARVETFVPGVDWSFR